MPPQAKRKTINASGKPMVRSSIPSTNNNGNHVTSGPPQQQTQNIQVSIKPNYQTLTMPPPQQTVGQQQYVHGQQSYPPPPHIHSQPPPNMTVSNKMNGESNNNSNNNKSMTPRMRPYPSVTSPGAYTEPPPPLAQQVRLRIHIYFMFHMLMYLKIFFFSNT